MLSPAVSFLPPPMRRSIAGAGVPGGYLLTSRRWPRATHARHPLDPLAQAPDARAVRDRQLAEWLAAAARGDHPAFERFYDATLAYAHALARRMVRSADLEDLLADAFFQAWREAARFDAARGSPVTWLLTLVRSRCLDRLRHQRASPEVEGAGEPDDEWAASAPGPDDLLAAAESGSHLHAALAALSPNERWVLGLAYWRELTHREICEITALPLGTVKSLILRAQAKLRDRLSFQ